MAKQKLDLFEFAAAEMTQSSAGSPKVMRCNFLDPRSFRRSPHDVPDHLGGNATAVYAAPFVNRAKNSPPANPRCPPPVVDSDLDPSGHGHCADVSPLPYEISDDPTVPSVVLSLDEGDPLQDAVQPIIALTAHAMPGDRSRCTEDGIIDYLSEPMRTPAFAGNRRRSRSVSELSAGENCTAAA